MEHGKRLYQSIGRDIDPQGPLIQIPETGLDTQSCPTKLMSPGSMFFPGRKVSSDWKIQTLWYLITEYKCFLSNIDARV